MFFRILIFNCKLNLLICYCFKLMLDVFNLKNLFYFKYEQIKKKKNKKRSFIFFKKKLKILTKK